MNLRPGAADDGEAETPKSGLTALVGGKLGRRGVRILAVELDDQLLPSPEHVWPVAADPHVRLG